MLVHGREIKFKRTVQATCEIAEICPDGDINKFVELSDLGYSTSQKAAAVLVCALARGYELSRKYEEPGYVPQELTVEEVLSLDIPEYMALVDEAVEVFKQDAKTTVETEPVKGKNAEAAE
jgi:hypothetical protein